MAKTNRSREVPRAPSEVMDVEVRSGAIELRGGIKAKKGDIIQVPRDEARQTPATRWGLKTGNLVRVFTTIDLPPVTSTEVPEE